jgi:hypothetical protein
MLNVGPSDSEPAYFWYQNQVKIEAQYLLTEALPDWKHKATNIEHGCLRQGISLESGKADTGAQAEFGKWFSTLQDEVHEWKRMVETLEVPKFDLAVADLMALQGIKKVPIVKETVANSYIDGEAVMRKIEKVDSGIDF